MRAALEVHEVADHAVVADDRRELAASCAAPSRPGSTCGRRSRCGRRRPAARRSARPTTPAPIVDVADHDGVGVHVGVGMDAGARYRRARRSAMRGTLRRHHGAMTPTERTTARAACPSGAATTATRSTPSSTRRCICHLGLVDPDGRPFVIPTIHARVGDVALRPRLAGQPGAAHRARRRRRRAASRSRSSTGSCSPARRSTTR